VNSRGDRAYAELVALSRERALLASCSALLEWDEDTIMPSGGIEHRSRQRALLAGLEHDRWLDPRLGDLLHEAEAESETEDLQNPASPRGVNLREWKRQLDRHKKLSRTLVEELETACTIGQYHFALAQKRNNYGDLEPWLDNVLRLSREKAAVLSEGDLYDALLDEYEPRAKQKRLEPLFGALAGELRARLEKISPDKNTLNLRREVPPGAQRAFLELATEKIGFDYSKGRLDEAAHPFTAQIGPGDTRITTRFVRDDFGEGFFCGLHELGHGLYDQSISNEHWGTPWSEPSSLAIHESQARLWENIVGRRRAFWHYFLPLLRKVFTPTFDDADLDELMKAVNRVERSPRRVRADALTYNLHIVIRFELERAMVSGALETKDLRDAWNASYRKYLDLTPKDDRDGVLQDGHWAAGMFGYFPTYALGNLVAAQLYAAAERELGSFDLAFAKGDFSTLLDWLRRKVHNNGAARSAEELVESVAHAPIDHRPFLAMLPR
jgi:carboxypeptidase Taq